jgi:hypothetical protein
LRIVGLRLGNLSWHSPLLQAGTEVGNRPVPPLTGGSRDSISRSTTDASKLKCSANLENNSRFGISVAITDNGTFCGVAAELLQIRPHVLHFRSFPPTLLPSLELENLNLPWPAMPESVALGIQHSLKNHGGVLAELRHSPFQKKATVKSQEQVATGRVLRPRFFSDYERRTIYLPDGPGWCPALGPFLWHSQMRNRPPADSVHLTNR